MTLRPACVLFAVCLAGSLPARADERAQVQACARLAERDARLACFDALAASLQAPSPGEAATVRAEAQQAPPDTATATATATSEPASGSPLSRHWELAPADKRPALTFRPHRDNYVLLANYSRAPNAQPYLPFAGIEPDASLSHTELAFQLGFKLKLVQAALATPFDLWFGYTQNSFWQAYNSPASSPFRESNYQPELMAVAPLQGSLLGWRARLLNVGFVHQSNGQASTLSRSWNRVYVQAGLERGDATLLARVWQPVGALDDNPDIQRYLGHGDLMARWRWGGHAVTALLRRNWQTHHGAAQVGWTFPLAENLKGYVQLFSGYGDSLINYNARQDTLGVGVLVGF